MKTWLFTWNPLSFSWDDRYDGYKEMASQIKQAGKSYKTWTCGVTTSIKEGDRIFLIKLGEEPRGIIASGYAASNVFTGPHYDEMRAKKGDIVKRIFVEFDKIVDFKNTPLSMRVLKEINSNFTWSPQASGISIPNDTAEELERIWK